MIAVDHRVVTGRLTAVQGLINEAGTGAGRRRQAAAVTVAVHIVRLHAHIVAVVD